MNDMFVQARIDSLTTIRLTLAQPLHLTKEIIQINQSPITYIEKKSEQEYICHTQKSMQLDNPVFLTISNYPPQKVGFGRVVETAAFDEIFYYDGELGAIYSPQSTHFKVWAPTAETIYLLLDDKRFEMTKEVKGVYTFKQQGDCHGLTYMYEVHVDHQVYTVVDPYTKASTINGEKGVVVDMPTYQRSQSNFSTSKIPIIYELHVRDATIHSNSGVMHKGKYLGLTEQQTRYVKDKALKTGIDYIADLGVTHVQLLPIADYSAQSVDEREPLKKYNWGYDPLHFNTPEGSYSLVPTDPLVRINELQQLIASFHNAGLYVILDVVYNHVYHIKEHSFDKLVPNYYFRRDEAGVLTDGTGVGNDIASERKMVRKFIVDSIVHWAELYQVDGFRFDLMGMLDIATMQAIVEALQQINPNIFLLGEGWDMGTLPAYQKPTQYNAYLLPTIAFFNDNMRDGLKGSTWQQVSKGFISGELYKEGDVLQNIFGAKVFYPYTTARQVIQYVEAHDNYTLWDQLMVTNVEESIETRIKRHRLATSIVLLSFGVPFIHAGQEFLRTKKGIENSYNAPDDINALDWDRAWQYQDEINYVKRLIAIRQKYPVFQLYTYEAITQVVSVLKDNYQTIAYRLYYDNVELIIIHCANDSAQWVELANGTYDVVLSSEELDKQTLIVSEAGITVAPLSTVVLQKR